VAKGTATSPDGTRIAWYRYGGGEQTILFVPTWNLVDARVVGHQVAALESHADVLTYDPRGRAPASGRNAATTFLFTRTTRSQFSMKTRSSVYQSLRPRGGSARRCC
jgi:hypothetical protein